MRWSRLWTVIFCATAGACGAGPATSATSVPAASSESAPVEQAHDEVIHLDPVDLVALEEPPSDSSPLRKVVSTDREGLRACWSASFGQVTLSLELNATGLVVGGSTEPAGGQEGLAAVADCVLERARLWRFPANTGGTRVLVAPLAVPET